MNSIPVFPDTVKILCVGVGAVGGFYGARLAAAGAEVSVVCRSDHDTVKRQGIAIDSIDGDFHFTPHAVFGQVPKPVQPMDYILVGLKVLPEISVSDIIRPAVGPNTAIVLLQNGVEIEESVAKAFPKNEIISGLAFICVNRTAPGHIRHLCYGRLTLGLYPQGRSDKVDQLGRLFEKSRTPCHISENVVTDRWQKLVWNAPFNPISMLVGANTREILEVAETANLVEKVMEEVCRVAAAAGHPLPPGIVKKNLDDTYRMAPYLTSMLLDRQAGRPMEVEAILGNAVRAADRCGLQAPYMETLYGILKLVVGQSAPRETWERGVLTIQEGGG
ncbi:MAG: 2-dehydropantoate 2-reductase [Magnetococcales bacterium]|nr:2-dehydropantoate 2-reductase [Magnetococcales bacterium]